jgi:hypothetical protein
MRLFTHQPRISLKEQLFVCYAGLIRGAIAFGLVLRLSGYIKVKEKLDIIETTALTLVVSTTLIFGSTMSLMQKLLLPKLTKAEINQQLIGENELDDDQTKLSFKSIKTKEKKIDSKNDSINEANDHYE